MSNPLKISVLCVFSIIVQMILGDDFRNDSLFLWRATDYKLSEWRGRTEFDYIKNIDKWDFGCISLPTNRLDLASEKWNENSIGQKTLYVFNRRNDFSIRIDVSLLQDVNSAHDEIVKIFSNMASTRLYAEKKGLGDKGYQDSNGNWTSAIFARNNVVVEIRSEFDFINALDVAKQIDKEILKQSGVKTGQPSTSGGKKTVKPNERERKDNGKGN